MEQPVDQGEARREPQGFIEKLLYYYAASMMLALVGLIIYVVVARYLLNRPPIWGEDVPRLIFLWGIFLSAPLAIRMNLNIRVGAIDAFLSERQLRPLKTVLHLIVLAFLAIVFVNALPLVKLALRGTMLSTGLSNAFLRLPIMVGTALMFLAQLDLLVRVWREDAK